MLVVILLLLDKVSIVDECSAAFNWLSNRENWLSHPKSVTGVFLSFQQGIILRVFASEKSSQLAVFLLLLTSSRTDLSSNAFHLHSWTLVLLSLSILVFSYQRSLLHISATICFQYSFSIHTYIEKEWFKISSEVYSELADLFIFPLMERLGIDVKQIRKLQEINRRRKVWKTSLIGKYQTNRKRNLKSSRIEMESYYYSLRESSRKHWIARYFLVRDIRIDSSPQLGMRKPVFAIKITSWKLQEAHNRLKPCPRKL